MSLTYQSNIEQISPNFYSLSHKRHGRTHKINGPAIIWNTSELWFYQYGNLHRLNGPALTLADKSTKFCIRGKTLPDPI
jgi:hypothetical protein